MYKLIPILNRQENAIVDEDLWKHLLLFSNWSYSKGYARCCKKQKSIYMHRLVLKLNNIEIPDKQLVDHINRNKLDNRLQNLRIVTPTGNGANRDIIENSVGYKGVYKNYDKWIAQITILRKVTHLGRFNSPEEAARAYNEAAIYYYKECAVLNHLD